MFNVRFDYSNFVFWSDEHSWSDWEFLSFHFLFSLFLSIFYVSKYYCEMFKVVEKSRTILTEAPGSENPYHEKKQYVITNNMCRFFIIHSTFCNSVNVKTKKKLKWFGNVRNERWKLYVKGRGTELKKYCTDEGLIA